MTEEEADEVLHTAMTVGATRMQVMLSQETTKLGWANDPQVAATGDLPTRSPSPEGAAAVTFSAAEVVEQTDGG